MSKSFKFKILNPNISPLELILNWLKPYLTVFKIPTQLWHKRRGYRVWHLADPIYLYWIFKIDVYTNCTIRSKSFSSIAWTNHFKFGVYFILKVLLSDPSAEHIPLGSTDFLTVLVHILNNSVSPKHVPYSSDYKLHRGTISKLF